MVKSTSNLIKIKDIRDDVVITEDGGLRAILAVPGINFSLLSEQEKEAVVGLFKELLDGLDFSIQIFVVSRLAYIEGYINYLKERLEQETEPLIKIQLEEYIKFIQDYVETHRIMKKLFYIVIPYETEIIKIGGLFKREYKKEEEFYQQLEQLETRVIYITEKLSALGLQPIRLKTPELIQLFYELYNPNPRWGMAPIKLFEELMQMIEE
jgi:type IV secretory pathway VirB4 component